jgi:hypothetical protein
MKPKSFVLIFILLCVLVYITFFVFHRENPSSEASRMGEMLFAHIPLDDITAVRISHHETDGLKTVNLKKSGSEWVVEDLFGFPADFRSISELVGKLKESKIGRHFEVSPDALSRLTLYEPGQADISHDETAIRIQLLDKDQKALADVLVGKPRESSTGAGAHYLKPTGENTVYLVDQTFRSVGKQPREWIQADLLDIPSTDIETVTCIDSELQSAIYSVKRPERGASPEFHPPVDNKSIKSRTVELLFDTLSSLRVQDIAGPIEKVSEEITGFGTLPYFDFQLFDGTLYRIYPGKKASDEHGGYYLKIEVSRVKSENGHEKSAAESPEETPVESNYPIDNEAAPDNGSGEISHVAINPEEPAIEAYNLNRKLSPWVYIISDWEHQSMVTDPEAFFEDKDGNGNDQNSTTY